MSVLDGLNFGFKRKLPLILQTEASECGLASVAMIANYLGHEIDLFSIRKRFSMSLKGTTLANLISIAEGLKLTPRPVKADLEQIGQLSTPCVLHWNLNHFVVLKSVHNGGVVIHDPAVGIVKISTHELSKYFTGVALELRLSSDFTKKKEIQSFEWTNLVGKTIGLKRSLLQIFALAFSLQVFSVVAPFMNQWVIDEVLVSNDVGLLNILVIGFFMLAIIQTLISVLRSWVIMIVSVSLRVQWASNVFSHLLKLPLSWYEKRHIGDVSSRFSSVSQIQETLTNSFVEAIMDGIMASITLIILFVYSKLLAFVAISAITTYALFRLVFYTPLKLATEQYIVAQANTESNFLETLRAISCIRLYNATSERLCSWQNYMVSEQNCGLKIGKMNVLFSSINSILIATENILIIWLAATLVMDKQLTVGMMIAFLSFKQQFSSRTSALIDKWLEFKMLRLQAERLSDIVLTEKEGVNDTVGSNLENVEASIELKNISFRYGENEDYVLKGLSIKIMPGESVAIVGASGCGKSTLLKILLGIQKPESGEILIGGHSINNISIKDYRNMVGVVMQDDQLLSGSISSNISFSDPTPSQERVEYSAKLAAIHEEISSFPMQYSTLSGDMGGVLSGGQKQRVLLARALYKQPKILFLDEATSHLDTNNERLVNMAIKKLSLTRIIIAHRPETIQMADRVIKIENGKAYDF